MQNMPRFGQDYIVYCSLTDKELERAVIDAYERTKKNGNTPLAVGRAIADLVLANLEEEQINSELCDKVLNRASYLPPKWNRHQVASGHRLRDVQFVLNCLLKTKRIMCHNPHDAKGDRTYSAI